MLDIQLISHPNEFPTTLTRDAFTEFLYNYLQPYGDSREAIGKAIDYAFSEESGKGGFLLAAFHEQRLVGALVMNETGMAGYIPENVLVYIAVDPGMRGRGFGKRIIDAAKKQVHGDIKLHVEYENPAKRLYEREGFTSKYAEMRWTQEQ